VYRDKILLIGSQGRLGASLLAELKEQYTVDVFDEKFVGTTSSLSKCDCIDLSQFSKIIITVGATNVNKCASDLDYAYRGNIQPYIEVQRNHSFNELTTQVLKISTDQVYSGEGNHLEGVALPENSYGTTKLIGEKIHFHKQTILRTNYVSKGTSKKASFTDWAYNTLKTQRQVHIFENIYFNPVALKHLINNIKFALREEILGIYNIGCKAKISKADFYENFGTTLGIKNHKAVRQSYDQHVYGRRPLDMSMCISKARDKGFDIPDISQVISLVSQEYGDVK
jgi:dTDP-4-dehydrorhamnose reductase